MVLLPLGLLTQVLSLSPLLSEMLLPMLALGPLPQLLLLHPLPQVALLQALGLQGLRQGSSPSQMLPT